MAIDCKAFNNFLFRRVPNWDKKLVKNRQPRSILYSNMYGSSLFPAFTGTEHFRDKIYVTRPNDNGAWEAMNTDNCVGTPCSPTPKHTGWGSDRYHYGKYRQLYESPVFCFDQLRHVEEAVAQLEAIVDGHKKMPDMIVSDFVRLLSMRQADNLYICQKTAGGGGLEIPVTGGQWSADFMTLNLGSDANLPTSKLTMNYLNRYAPTLSYKGYWDSEFMPGGKFLMTCDIQTEADLTNQNPALAQMYQSADFAKGGAFFDYGVMSGAGKWLFKIDGEPMRFQRVGDGLLERVLPFENLSATVGKKPVFDPAYEGAEFQLFHVVNKAARELKMADITPVNPDMKFKTGRSTMGKWSWYSPEGMFTGTDPSTGEVCTYDNVLGNMGKFVGYFELGMDSPYPEIEMHILAQREPKCWNELPRCAARPAVTYQELTPYNEPTCPESEGEAAQESGDNP